MKNPTRKSIKEKEVIHPLQVHLQNLLNQVLEKNDEEKTISETVIFIVQDKGDFEYDIELYNENKKKKNL